MLFRKKLLTVKRKHLGWLLLLTAVLAICLAFSLGSAVDFAVARREILLRRVGHEVLLQAGDSSSRVLPVKRNGKNEYELSFENPFAFQPDSLVQTTSRLLAGNPLASAYVVTVLNCGDSGVAYGYAISGNKKEDIIACLGRQQPKACYRINIKFQAAETALAKNGYLLGGVALLALLGVLLVRPAKQRRGSPVGQPAIADGQPAGDPYPSAGTFTLGATSFDAERRTLRFGEKTTELTKTETRVLRIFAAVPNEAIERSRLQKEIWEDEGVIVGRSLDMFISKLRKKLEPDPTVKIAVIRRKGYRLEIGL